MQVLLWVSLILFIAAIVAPRKFGYSVGAIGWLVFALHWAVQPVHYWAINDYFNVIITLAVAAFCAYLAFIMWKRKDEHTLLITKAAAVGGIFYFSFAEFSYLNHLLVAAVASQTTEILHIFSVPIIQVEWNMLTLNGYPVEIILGCTGIESIALFLGVIACVPAPLRRKLAAFLITVPVIYALNIARNAFVLTASGYSWFGVPDYSFYIAHNVIAKFGSLVALVCLSYLVFKMLPGLLDIVTNAYTMFTEGINRAS